MAKYNTKKNLGTVGNLLGSKSKWGYYVNGKTTYRNTPDDWQDKVETKSKNEMNEFLLESAVANNRKCIQMALTRGEKADINAVDKDGNNALMLAVFFASESHLAGVKYILDFFKDEIDLNHLNDNGFSVLHIAVHLNKPKIVEMLLEAGVSPNILGREHETPIFIATRQDNPEMIELLKKNLANLNAVNKKGLTPLMVAGQQKDRKHAFKKLLDLGANMFAEDFRGRTTFMHVSNHPSCSAMLDMMLAKAREMDKCHNGKPNFNKLVNHQDRDGVSSMMIIAKEGNREALRVLVANGANPYLKDKNGNDALDYAIKYGNPTCKEILEKTYRIYAKAEEIENLDERSRFLKKELWQFALQNQNKNLCVRNK